MNFSLYKFIEGAFEIVYTIFFQFRNLTKLPVNHLPNLLKKILVQFIALKFISQNFMHFENIFLKTYESVRILQRN